jgi:hypothetical protein
MVKTAVFVLSTEFFAIFRLYPETKTGAETIVRKDELLRKNWLYLQTDGFLAYIRPFSC